MNRKLQFLVNLAYWGTIAALVCLTFRYLFPLLLPFLLGFSVAAVWNPLITKLSKYRKRSFCSWIVILPFWGTLLFLLWEIGVLLYGEVVDLLQWIQNTDFGSVFSSVQIPFFGETAKRWILDRTDDFLPTVIGLSQSALKQLLNLLLELPNAVLFSVTVIISSFLFSLLFPKIEPFLLRQMSARMQTEYFDVKEFLFRKMFRIVRAYGTMLGINYVQLLIGFLILKVPYPLILAAAIALFDLLPYVGMASVLIPWGIVEWIVFARPTLAVGLIVLAAVVSLIREILEPKIVGKTIGLSPLATLFSVYLGLKISGIAGMLLFPLLLLFLKEWNDSGRLLLWKSVPDEP